MKEKVVIIGGKGTAVVIAEQIYDAQIRFGKEIEVIGFAFDDPAFLGGASMGGLFCVARRRLMKNLKMMLISNSFLQCIVLTCSKKEFSFGTI